MIEHYAGQRRDLLNLLDGDRQVLGNELGPDHPLFRLVDDAMRRCDAFSMEEALKAVERWRHS